jgi:hypothetical protein
MFASHFTGPCSHRFSSFVSQPIAPFDCSVFVLQFVVNVNETLQEDNSLSGDKIISPLKESVSEVEKLVRAGVLRTSFTYICGFNFY